MAQLPSTSVLSPARTRYLSCFMERTEYAYKLHFLGSWEAAELGDLMQRWIDYCIVYIRRCPIQGCINAGDELETKPPAKNHLLSGGPWTKLIPK